MRKFGVEKEFLLVSAGTGEHTAVAEDLLAGTAAEKARRARVGAGRTTPGQGNTLTAEAQREQVEAVSAPFTGLPGLSAAIREGRAEADRQAGVFGARIAAIGTWPFPALPHLIRSPRYLHLP